MDYAEASAWAASLKEPQHWDLGKVKAIAAYAGLDLGQLKAIHVGGTNGKGSVCAMVEAILRAQGYKTGLYTSPHLLDVRERIRVNGTDIPKLKFAALAEWAMPFVEEKGASYFEALTLMAFRHFLDEKVDFAVVEVGLGGKLDATNILAPKVAVITNVALEHTEKLGGTPELIALEKGGIIKKGCPVVAGAEGLALHSLERVAIRQKAALRHVTPLKIVKQSPLTVELSGKPIELGLQGAFQAQNAALAVAAIEELQKQGVAISQDSIRKGLQTVGWPGRMQEVGNVVVDGAHNPAGVGALVSSLKQKYPERRWNLVFGVLADKDYLGMVDVACKLPLETVTLVTPKSPRALEAERLEPLFREKGIKAKAGSLLEAIGKSKAGQAGSPAEAIGKTGSNRAGSPARRPTLVCGSLYVVAEALALLEKNKADKGLVL